MIANPFKTAVIDELSGIKSDDAGERNASRKTDGLLGYFATSVRNNRQKTGNKAKN